MARQAASSRLRVVIGINRWNDPGVQTTTKTLMKELTNEVDRWQAELNAVYPGVAVVVGHLVELGIRDGAGNLVDGDVLRELLKTPAAEGVKFKKMFPYAAVREALVTSGATWRAAKELFGHRKEVWLHVGDDDVVDYGSLFASYAQEIVDSQVDGAPSELMRIGGGYRHDPWEIDRPKGMPQPPEGYDASFSAKLTVLLAEADNLHRQAMSSGRLHLGAFSERNTLLNARYLEQLLPAFSPAAAKTQSYPDIAVPMNRKMFMKGLLTEKRSRFLSEPRFQVTTSVSGKKGTFTESDSLRFLTDQDEVRHTGKTLAWIARNFRFGGVGKAHNLTFGMNINHMLGKSTKLVVRKTLRSLLDPQQRAVLLSQLGDELGDEPAELVADTRTKLLRAQQINDRFEKLLAKGLENYSLEELLTELRGYATQPPPRWYLRETGTQISSSAQTSPRIQVGNHTRRDRGRKDRRGATPPRTVHRRRPGATELRQVEHRVRWGELKDNWRKVKDAFITAGLETRWKLPARICARGPADGRERHRRSRGPRRGRAGVRADGGLCRGVPAVHRRD